MRKRSTNLDLRAYATAHGVRLYELARALGTTPSIFSVQYMRMELPKSVKDELKAKIREIENDNKRVQA